MKKIIVIMMLFLLVLSIGCTQSSYTSNKDPCAPFGVEKDGVCVPKDSATTNTVADTTNSTDAVADTADSTNTVTDTTNSTDAVADTTDTVVNTTDSADTVADTTDSTDVVADTTNYAKTIDAKIGDKIDLRDYFSATDADKDNLTYTFSSPFDSKGVWTVDKTGDFKVDITVSDGKASSEATFLIKVEATNHDPKIAAMDDITVDEGETITLDIEVSDEDGDDVTTVISGWMDSKTKETDYNDAGKHEVTIKAKDGNGGVDAKVITVTVNDVNRAPKLVIN